MKPPKAKRETGGAAGGVALKGKVATGWVNDAPPGEPPQWRVTSWREFARKIADTPAPLAPQPKAPRRAKPAQPQLL